MSPIGAIYHMPSLWVWRWDFAKVSDFKKCGPNGERLAYDAKLGRQRPIKIGDRFLMFPDGFNMIIELSKTQTSLALDDVYNAFFPRTAVSNWNGRTKKEC